MSSPSVTLPIFDLRSTRDFFTCPLMETHDSRSGIVRQVPSFGVLTRRPSRSTCLTAQSVSTLFTMVGHHGRAPAPAG